MQVKQWIGGFLMFSAVAFAEAEFSLPLKLLADSPGYVFMVPDVVYERAHYADLRDVRVFNALGDEVPMRLSKNLDQIKKTFSEVTLPIFSLNQSTQIPVNSKQVKTTWEGGLQRHTVDTSNIVKNYLLNQESERLDTILIDASSVLNEQAVALNLAWQFPIAGNRVFYVELKGSNDLSRWQVLQPKHKLVELDTGDRVVIENSIPLPGAAFEFYQLRFLDLPIPEVVAVRASMQYQAVNAEVKWSEVSDFQVVNSSDIGHTIAWELDGYYPVEAVKFNFDYKNLMADVQVYSKHSAQSTWRRVAKGAVYAVGTGEMSMFNNQLALYGNNHRYWKMTSQSAISTQWVDSISFAWRQHQIRFLAQGEGPYSLRFGQNLRNKPAISQWYQQLNPGLKQSLFSNQVAFAVFDKVEPMSESKEDVNSETHSSTWLFWGVLVLVLTGLLLMATQLLKEVADD